MSIADGVANHATIRLETLTSTSYFSHLSIPTDVFTNAVDGLLEVNAGSGGTRTVTGNVTNSGTIAIEAGVQLNVTGDGNAAFTQADGGEITGAGELFVLSGSMLHWTGGTINATAGVWSSTLSLPADSTGTGTVLACGSSTLDGTVLPGQTVWVQGRQGKDALLTPAAGATNEGTIHLENLSSDNYYSNLSIPGGQQFVNEPNGVIAAYPGSGGARSIAGHLVNQGSVTADPGTVLPLTGIYEAAGGQLVGETVYVSSSEVRVTAENSGEVQLRGNCTLTTDNLPGTILWVQGVQSRDATLSIADGVANHATIRLETLTSTSYFSHLSIPTDVFTNAVDGLLEVNAGSGGTRTVTGNVTNSGTIAIEAGVRLNVTGDGNAAFTQADGGEITGAGELFVLSGSMLHWTGGTINATAGVWSSTLSLPADSTGAGTVLACGSSTLDGTVLPGQTVWVQGRQGKDALLTTSDGATNEGTIRLETLTSTSYYSNLSIPASQQFANEPSGMIVAYPGSGGLRVLTATDGFVNDGTLAAGEGVLLTINADLTQTDTASMLFELGGLTTSEYGRIDVNGNATLNGAMEVVLVGGFAPVLSDEFNVATFDSSSGLFTCHEVVGPELGEGLYFAVDQDPSTALRVYVAEGDGPADGDIDCDGDVDLDDYAIFAECMAGPGMFPVPIPPTSPYECLDAFDIDADDDVDMRDFADFQRRLGQ